VYVAEQLYDISAVCSYPDTLHVSSSLICAAVSTHLCSQKVLVSTSYVHVRKEHHK
jgi:hypothetical protein